MRAVCCTFAAERAFPLGKIEPRHAVVDDNDGGGTVIYALLAARTGFMPVTEETGRQNTCYA